VKIGTGTSLTILKIVEVLLKSEREMETLHEGKAGFTLFIGHEGP
jgi:hypothetical protein